MSVCFKTRLAAQWERVAFLHGFNMFVIYTTSTIRVYPVDAFLHGFNMCVIYVHYQYNKCLQLMCLYTVSIMCVIYVHYQYNTCLQLIRFYTVSVCV